MPYIPNQDRPASFPPAMPIPQSRAGESPTATPASKVDTQFVPELSIAEYTVPATKAWEMLKRRYE